MKRGPDYGPATTTHYRNIYEAVSLGDIPTGRQNRKKISYRYGYIGSILFEIGVGIFSTLLMQVFWESWS